MKNQTLMPVYEVIASDPSGSIRPVTKTFTDSCLLTARNNALRFAQQLQAKPQRTHVLEITVRLVKINRTVLGSKPEVIATIFRLQLQPNLILPTAKPTRIDTTVNPVGRAESFNSLNWVWSGLEDMDRESGYYHAHKLDTGFGFVQMDQIAFRDQLAKDPASVPERCYTVLYDGFPFAASLISNYNDQRTEDSEILSFSTLFLPPQ